jgi:fatty-acyl-CoA synthase
MSLQARVTTKLHTLYTLAEAGIISPTRPDRLVALAQTLLRWGPTPAAGYTAAAIRHPNDTAIIDELGTLTFQTSQAPFPASGPPTGR